MLVRSRIIPFRPRKTMDNTTVAFGFNVRVLRLERRLSQEELAFMANISAAHLGQIERAEKSPTLVTVGKIANALSVSVAELFSFPIVREPDELDTENQIAAKIVAMLAGLSPTRQKDMLRIIEIVRRNMSR